tara:strand:- start:580 stop:954 length:375 start_codon:yes stop_codon:yes gene_type:complete
MTSKDLNPKINGNRIKYSLDDFPNLMELKKVYKKTTIPLNLLKSACYKDGLKCGKGYPVQEWPSYMKRKEKDVITSTKKKIKNVVEEHELKVDEVEDEVEELEEEIEDEGYDVDEFKDEDSDIE